MAAALGSRLGLRHSVVEARRALNRARDAINLNGMRAMATQSDQNFHVPVVNFNKFWNGSVQDRLLVSQEVVRAFRDVGFLYIKNHNIDEKIIARTFQESDEFFNLPQEVKDKLAWKDPRANRGYVKQGRERVTQSSDPDEIAELRRVAPDVKESIEIGNDADPVWRNHWPPPAVAPNFTPTMLQFYDICHELHMDVLRAIALGLGLNENYFDPLADGKYHTMRLLNYPPVSRELLAREGQARLGAHSDYGSLTFVFQDDVGGLEVQNPHTQSYIPAIPIPGTIVVNAGDLLARWSNDLFRSTLHRVVSPVGTDSTGPLTPKRRSIAYFCNPNADTIVECLPGCEGDGPKYPAVRTEDYVVGRLSDTYD